MDRITKEEIIKKLEYCVSFNSQTKEYLKSDKKVLINDYKRGIVRNRFQIEYSEKSFEKSLHEVIIFLSEQENILNGLLSLVNEQNSSLSVQMKELLFGYIEEIEGIYWNFEPRNWFELLGWVNNKKAYESILLLNKFANYEKNVVLIGGNGSGKSTLAATLKGDEQSSISVIPAQKSLFFSLNDDELLRTRLQDAKEALLYNNIESSKESDGCMYQSFQMNQFSKLIVATREEHYSYLRECQAKEKVASKNKSIFDRMKIIFNSLFPDIDLNIVDDIDDYIRCEKNGEKYSINALSEGEKAVIYYVLSVLISEENGIIVVDEPETYLNPSIANILWDKLVMEREDCKFIFITHSVNFVISRKDAQIIWLNNFSYPNTFSFKEIDDSFDLPKELMTDILGSRKPILFCEGDNKSSLDYSVYKAVMGDKYTVLPVGGHRNVIQYCKTIKSNEWMQLECNGIIDFDNMDDETKEKNMAYGVLVLPYNEIEMLLMSRIVIEYMAEKIYPQEAEKKLEDYYNEFWSAVEKKKDRMALKHTKRRIDNWIENEKIDSDETIEKMKESLNHIAEYDLEEEYHTHLEEIGRIIKDRDYNKMLTKCNLKTEISRGLANRCFIRNYENVVLEHISTNKELQNQLFETIFTQ